MDQNKITEVIELVKGLNDEELSAFNEQFSDIMSEREGELPGADEAGVPHEEVKDLDGDQSVEPPIDMDAEIPFTKKH